MIGDHLRDVSAIGECVSVRLKTNRLAFDISMAGSAPLIRIRTMRFDVLNAATVASPSVPGRASISPQLSTPISFRADTPRKPRRVPISVARSTTVSWIRPTTEERLENVARRYEMEENKQEGASVRAGSQRTRRKRRRTEERKARSYSSYSFAIERPRRSCAVCYYLITRLRKWSSSR